MLCPWIDFIEKDFSCESADLIKALAEEDPNVTAERKSLVDIRETLIKVRQARLMTAALQQADHLEAA